MIEKKLFGFIPVKCFRKYCLDEVTGIIAILLGIVGYVVQFIYSEKSWDLTSFSIVALFFSAFAELFFLIQGVQKESATIAITRSVTFLAFTSFIVLWFVTKNKNKEKKKDEEEDKKIEGHKKENDLKEK